MDERAIYPGHPIVIGVHIMRAFPSLEAANKRGKMFRAALCSTQVPGAGGNVHSALRCLRVATDGDIDAAVRMAAQVWANCDNQRAKNPGRWSEGVEQAARYEQEFREMVSKWPGVSDG